ncbi:MAG: LTA synthase family protein [Bacteroidales bacterium]|nr:LTA synthase family protein [Bacteroidales bacterium]
MRKRLIAILFYALFWLVFFAVARLFFILTHFNEASGHPFTILAATFWYGLTLDLSATGYIMLIPLLLLIPNIYFNRDWYRIFLKWYTYAIIVISSVIIVTDTLLYKYWGFRMDHTVLFYLRTPKEALASVTFLQIMAVILLIVLLSAVFIFVYSRYVSNFFHNFGRIRLWIPAMLFFLILFGSLIIPIRGGIGIAPVNAGSVYFSNEVFINHTAVNVVWNTGDSFVNRKPVKNPYIFYDLPEARELTGSLTARGDDPVRLVNTKRPNILLIVLESFGNVLIGPLGGDPLTTPNINRYCEEGILFTNFYASGNRTDKSFPAILNGYPAQPKESIMKHPKKTQSLPGLVSTLTRYDYNTSFWYGGEINFANFNSYVLNSGFGQIVTMDDFDPRFYNSKWGVHDHILLNTLMDSMKHAEEPFFKVVLTLSSHEPFDVPMEAVFEGNDDLMKFKNSVFYTDRSLGSFIEGAKNSDWWENTLVVLVADHCRRNSGEDLIYSEDIFRIPMLWLGGALDKTGIQITKYGSQADIPLTLLNQLDMEDSYPFAKDLLSNESASFAFYTFNDGFAFITDSSGYIYDHRLGSPVIERGKHPETAGRYGKAFLQTLYDDFLNR